MKGRAGLAIGVIAVVVSLLAAWIVGTRVRLSPDVSTLLPDGEDGGALARYSRRFGGGDPGIVLVVGPDEGTVERAAGRLAEEAAGRPSVKRVLDAMEVPIEPTAAQWMTLASPAALSEIRVALTREGARRRISETRAILLAPGSSALVPALTRDPLRLGEIVRKHVPAAAFRRELVSANGLARLVIVEPRGSALTSRDSAAFVADMDLALAATRSAVPGASLSLTGGHAVAAATERMIRHDVAVSSVLSIGLVGATFTLLFGRARALLAILPPLALGTVITAAFAALFPPGLSAIAVAFVAVVVGIGMDTGVHAYAAVMRAMASGHPDPASEARRTTWRPALGAASVAAAAFGCLALSDVSAVRQLGILAAVGEIVTALTLLAVTPTLAVWLESLESARPAPPRRLPPRFARLLAARPFAAGVGLLALGCLSALALGYTPSTTAGLVALRSPTLAPTRVYDEIAKHLGGAVAPWVILVEDETEARARARADRLAIALGPRTDLLSGLDAMTAFAPSDSLVAERRMELASVDLVSAAADLRAALTAQGLSAARFEGALADLEHPAELDLRPLRDRLAPRYLRADGTGAAVAIFVAPRSVEALRLTLRALDSRASLTGLPSLEPALRAALARDLPRASLVAVPLVVLALVVSLRRAREIAIAAFVIVGEIAVVLVGMRGLGVPLHVYDALVLPALVGVTVDEVLFLLFAGRHGGSLETEGPLVASTALGSAVGFGALLACEYPPLRHVGAVGALGSVAGIVLALGLAATSKEAAR